MKYVELNKYRYFLEENDDNNLLTYCMLLSKLEIMVSAGEYGEAGEKKR